MSEEKVKEEAKDVEAQIKKAEEAGNSFDMAAIETVTKSNDGVWLSLMNPATGEESSVAVKVLGYDSDVYIKWNAGVQADIKTKMLQAVADAKKHKKIDKGALAVPDDDEALAQLIVDWKNVIWDGEALPCNHDNVIKILSKVPAIKNQIRNFVEDRANFFAKALTTY